MSIELKVKRLVPNAKLPTRANPGDLGFDLFALDTVVMQAGQTVAAKTGVACQFPEGWGAILKPRSSQGKAGVDIFGGVVDSGYRGELIVLLHNTNTSEYDNGHLVQDGTVIYEAGNKIAQMVLVQVFPGAVEETTILDETVRGDKGFGSSGK